MTDPLPRTEDQDNRLAEVHVAEYTALTGRITYYVTLQYAAWTIGAALFGYLATMWDKVSVQQNLDWTALLCVIAVIWSVLHINYEMMLIVLYLKTDLLHRIAKDSAVSLEKVLGFEAWIRNRGRFEGFHRELLPVVPFSIGPLVLLVLLCRDISHRGWTWGDTRWAFVVGALLINLCMKMWRLWLLMQDCQHDDFRGATDL